MSTSHLLPWPKAMPVHVLEGSRLNEKMTQVLRALEDIGDNGATTRDISFVCDMSIYSARNWLIKLEDAGYIYRYRSDAKKTLWFIK